MASRNGYHAEQSSDLYITDGDQIDWLYGAERIFSFTWELYPPETATVWGDHYPPDERIAAATSNNRSALIYFLNAASCPYATIDRARQYCGPFYDDAEIGRGWQRDPDGTDTATTGRFSRGNPAPTSTSSGVHIQLDATASGRYAFATGLGAGATANANDLDGRTTIRSIPIEIAGDADDRFLVFRYSFAHGPSSTADSLKVYLEDDAGTRTAIWSKLGTTATVAGSWRTATVRISDPDPRTVRIVIQATDGGHDSLVEVAIDDIRIERPCPC
jgi:hypothetical protein